MQDLLREDHALEGLAVGQSGTSPAPDELIAQIEADLDCPIDGFNEIGIHPDHLSSLIARIKAEQSRAEVIKKQRDKLFSMLSDAQASQATAREQAIRECAEIAHTATMFTGCPLECMADEVRDAVLTLLQSKDSDAGIPASDPVRELRDNYKCGEEYEAGLWSRRNIEAFFRDQDKD